VSALSLLRRSDTQVALHRFHASAPAPDGKPS
jgi:hypothetical protein